MNWLIDIAALMVIPTVLLSFWRIRGNEEFRALQDSGQMPGLRVSALHAGYLRSADDPLRAAHIKLARIGFVHWAMMLGGFLAVFLAGVLLQLFG
ncbi:hypothetical protein [Aliiroseovarius crassostreae]|uniref:hypothetical protein n=1 Tax=Aliiroseovarius crassostreae TaxID=154981 RepID=UPI003C7DE5F0